MYKKIIICLMVVLLVLPIVYGVNEQSQVFAKILLDPFYRGRMGANTNYTYHVSIDPPDGFGQVSSAIVTFQMWIRPTIELFLTVNGRKCNTPSFVVHTTYAGSGEGTIFFDCSNVITTAGRYKMILTPDGKTGAITGWLDITYTNKPKATLEVHGTEYVIGQLAVPWLQLINSSGDYVNSAACQIDIYTNTGEELIEKAAMNNINHDGIYMYSIPTDNLYDGVFPVIARCYFDVELTDETVDGFTLVTGDVDSGDYTSTYILDGEEHKIRQDNGVLGFEYTVDNMCGLATDESLLSGFTVYVNAKWKDSPVNDDITIHIYNNTSSTWVPLNNKIVSPNDRVTVTNFISSTNYTRDGYVNESGTLILLFNDTLPTGSDKKLEMDWVQVTCDEFSNPNWEEVKGSSELHITADEYWSISVDSGQITNDTWVGNFYYNFTLSSHTGALRENVEIGIDLPIPFPCHHVSNVSINGVVETDQLFVNPSNPDTAGCRVTWYQDLNKGVNYEGQVIASNYFKEVERSWVTGNRIDYDMIYTICENYRSENSLAPYETPLLSMPVDNTSFYDACQQYLDRYYHWNYTYFIEFQTPVGILDYGDMDSLDVMWVHLLLVQHDLNQLAESLKQTMMLTSDYSAFILSNPLPSNLDYFGWLSGISSNNVLPSTIWNYTNRTLTENVTVLINTTTIANEVWTYNGTVETNIISQFVSSIWDYIGRYIHGIVN